MKHRAKDKIVGSGEQPIGPDRVAQVHRIASRDDRPANALRRRLASRKVRLGWRFVKRAARAARATLAGPLAEVQGKTDAGARPSMPGAVCYLLGASAETADRKERICRKTSQD